MKLRDFLELMQQEVAANPDVLDYHLADYFCGLPYGSYTIDANCYGVKIIGLCGDKQEDE